MEGTEKGYPCLIIPEVPVKAFLRRMLAILLGLLAGAAIMMLFEVADGWLYPALASMNPKDPEAMARAALIMPLGALLMLLAGWFLGTASGVWTALKIDGDTPRAGLVVGVLFLLGAVMNFYGIPHPAWFVVLSLLSFWPATALGLTLGEC